MKVHANVVAGTVHFSLDSDRFIIE